MYAYIIRNTKRERDLRLRYLIDKSMQMKLDTSQGVDVGHKSRCTDYTDNVFDI